MKRSRGGGGGPKISVGGYPFFVVTIAGAELGWGGGGPTLIRRPH